MVMTDPSGAVEAVARAVSMAMYGYDVIPNDLSLPYADGSRVGLVMRAATAAIAAMPTPSDQEKLQHVAYFDEGQFHWMSGIAPRDCELYAKFPDRPERSPK